MLCSELQLVKHEAGHEWVKPLPCNRWSCDHCASKRRFELKKLAASGEPNKFLTLTVNPDRGASPLERRDMLHDTWKKLVKRILRHFKWTHLHYMAFIEKTKRGEPHLHILLRCEYIPQAWLSDQMNELLGAPIVWIEKIHNTVHAIKYVTKYVTKEPGQFGTRKRYWVSRNWQVNKGDTVDRPVFDWRNTEIVRRRWSEELQKRVVSRFTWDEMPGGWIRFHAPGARRNFDDEALAGLVGSYDSG